MKGTGGSSDPAATIPETASDRAAAAEAPSGRVGRFELESVLGSGGMGVVFLARDPVLDRRVAIKLLRWQRGSADVETRLLREAQALARLTHPNVVTVYEAGMADGAVYLAMELVDGTTLRDWMESPRPWRETVEVFLAAGRGLAAAHAAGLVHRDFKPGNVLIDRAGRVKVGDFGLVGLASEIDGAPPTSPPGTRPGALDAALTQDGAIMGTPAYMAPEQQLGANVDARADQYAFATSLKEALPAMPPRVRAIVERGRAERAGDRYPTMTALLADLERVVRGRRWARGVVAVAAVAASAVTITLVLSGGERGDPCTGASERLSGIWDAARSDQTARHLGEIDPVQGAARFAVASSALDRQADAWKTMHRDACRANRVTHEQSDTLLDRRVACLERRRVELGAAADALLRAADPAALDRALLTTGSLTGLAGCADAEALLAITPPPEDAARRREVDAIAAEAAAINALRAEGTFAGLDERSDALVVRARAAGHPPALAEALRVRVDVLFATSSRVAAAVPLRELIEVAAIAHDDGLAAWAWSELLVVVAQDDGKPDDAFAVLPAARAALLRSGDDPDLRVSFHYHEAIVLQGVGRADEAQARLAEARTLLTRRGAGVVGNPLTRRLADLTYQSAVVDQLSGNYPDAETQFRRCVALYHVGAGPDHPEAAYGWHGLGESLRRQGKTDESLAAYREAARIREARLGDSGPLADTLTSLGAALIDAGQLPEAIEVLEHARAIHRRAGGPPLGIVTMTLGLAHEGLGHDDDARAAYDEAIALFESLGGHNSNLPITIFNRGNLANKLGDCETAIPDYRRSLELFTEHLGAAHPNTLYPVTALGRCLVLLGRWGEALPVLDRAVGFDSPGAPPQLLAAARFYRGRALVESGRDRAGGLRAARDAHAELVAMKDVAKTQAAEADAWLRSHE